MIHSNLYILALILTLSTSVNRSPLWKYLSRCGCTKRQTPVLIVARAAPQHQALSGWCLHTLHVSDEETESLKSKATHQLTQR